MTKSAVEIEPGDSSPHQSGTSLSENETGIIGTHSTTSVVPPGESSNNPIRYSRMASRISDFSALLLLLAVAVYAVLHVLTYLSSAAGRFPMLDGAENVELAQQMAGGGLPAEAFYRAMLYPALLSLFLRAGVPLDWLPVVAGFLGCLLHVGSTWCVYSLASRTWSSKRAGLFAAALFGLNPVAIYFAGEPLDTTISLFLFLAGLNTFHAVLSAKPRTPQNEALKATRFASSDSRITLAAAIGTAFWVLAMLARPHYAIVLAALPLLLIGSLWRSPAALFRVLVAFALIAGLGLGSAGLIQKRVGGQFRIMPTQGAYSLWVGNRPGANGRYFEQQVHIAAGSLGQAENPAHLESELLYRRETGQTGPLNADHVNEHWRKKTAAAIMAQPLAWIELMIHKAYYLFNNFEQYNNKTFAVQKSLSPWLWPNPLGWGVTFVLCLTGFVLARMGKFSCAGTGFTMSIAAVYGIGVILFFVSDRFRLPLLPFLCIGAGIWGCASRKQLLAMPGNERAMLGATALTASLLTFSRVWGVYDMSPAVQDYVLLSIGSGKSGNDIEGLRWARLALQKRPDHPDALARAVTSFYNLQLQGARLESDFPAETWAYQLERIALIPEPAAGVRLVQGVALWKSGRGSEASIALRALVEAEERRGSFHLMAEERGMRDAAKTDTTADDALGILLLAGLAEQSDMERALRRANNTGSIYLLSALKRRESTALPLISALQRRSIEQTETFVRNVFPQEL